MLPDETLAERIARDVTGQQPDGVRRFATGMHHFVYEAVFRERPPIVVRIAIPDNRADMVGAARLARRLRPRGVPLPQTLAEGLDAPCPYLVLERLAGEDLGRVVSALGRDALDRVAAGVVAAQTVVAREPHADRYGYAVESSAAPHRAWSRVLDDNMVRARGRMAAAGLFGMAPVDRVCALITAHRHALDALPATPFLHDATTKNVIVSGAGDLSGIVDVDDLCFGDPRYAAALTAASLAAAGHAPTYVTSLLAHGGWRDDRLFRLYVVSFLVDFMGEHGQVFNGNAAVSTSEDRARLSAVFVRAMSELE